MIASRPLRSAVVATAGIGLVMSCALPELTIDPSLDGQGGAAGSSSNDQAGSVSSAGKSNESGGSSSSGGSDEGGSDPGAAGDTTEGGTSSNTGGGGAGGGSGGCATMCSGMCKDLTSDELNCGKCGMSCGADQTCADSKCTGPCGATFEVSTTGIVTAPAKDACMHGIAFVVASGSLTTVTPSDFTACGADCKLCAWGSVGPDASYSGYAGIGVTLNQSSDGGGQGTIEPNGDTLDISISNRSNNPLRLWLYGPNGAVNAAQRWCYDLGTQDADLSIPYTDFKAECWATPPGGTYAGQALQQLLVHAIGSTSAVPYDFCINSFEDH